VWRGLAGWGVVGSCRVENGGVLHGGEWWGLAGWRMVGSCRVESGGVLWAKVMWVVAGCGVWPLETNAILHPGFHILQLHVHRKISGISDWEGDSMSLIDLYLP
jgi:hypothetical protein